MSRPTFQISPDILHSLRIARGLTQSQIADRLGQRRGFSPDGLAPKNAYQRVERTGRTSRKTADHLAAILECTVEQLQGAVPLDTDAYLRRLCNHLVIVLEKKESPQLQAMVEREMKDGELEPLYEVSRQLGRQIESAQLSRNPSRLALLSNLTGLSESDLLAPACMDGLWFVVTTTFETPRSQIAHGVYGVRWLVYEFFKALPSHCGSDSVVKIVREGNWFRVEIKAIHEGFSRVIEFIKCAAGSDGLKWIAPTKLDEAELRRLLSDLAHEYFNNVELFELPRSPLEITSLRVRLQDFDLGTGDVREEVVIAADIPDAVFKKFSADGSGFDLVMNWLTSRLTDHVRHSFPALPDGYWDISVQSGSIFVEALPPFCGFKKILPLAKSYRIDLCEQLVDGEYARVHLRDKHRAAFVSAIERVLSKETRRVGLGPLSWS